MSTTLTAAPSLRAKTYAENDDRFLFRRFRTWCLLLALFLMAQGNGLFTQQDGQHINLYMLRRRFDSVPSLLWLTGLLWVLCVGLMVAQIGPALRMMLKQKALLAFAALAFLSTLWSQEPQLTFRRAATLFLIFLFAWFFATRYSPADQMRLLLAAGVIVALASVAMAVLLPQYGISAGGEWKGVFGQKNRLGLSIVFLFSALPFCRIFGGRQLLKLAFQASLPLGLILLSESRTSLIMVAVLTGVRVFGPFLARRRREQLPFMLYAAFIGIPLSVLAIAVGKDIILPLLGRDATLTGRTESWAVLATFALQHLWIGYGYEAFWTGTGDSLRAAITVGVPITGSDSGYLDTMLQFGLLGIAMLLIVLLVSARDFVRLFRSASAPLIAYWYIGVILMTFVGSFTETLFLTSSGITTFVFVVACAGLRSLSCESPHWHESLGG